MLGRVFQRFVQRSPLSVMVCGTLERVLGAEQLNGLETHTSAALVRYSAAECTPLIKQVGGEREPWLAGLRVKIIDGNCLEASQSRIKALREVQAAALPGKSLVVYEPACGLVTDVVPCEDGHVQERALFHEVLPTVEPQDLWMADRNFCTRDFLGGLARRGASFVIREHQGLPFEIVTPLGRDQRTETGLVAEQRVRVVDTQGASHACRRLRLKLKEPTRDGETLLYILTNLPRHKASTRRVAKLYRKRWTVGVSREGHMYPVGESPTEVRSSSLVAWEAPWRAIKPVEPSDTMLFGSMRNTPGCNVQ